MFNHSYIGPAILSRVQADSTTLRFRGRMVHYAATDTYRFYVHNASVGGLPKGWKGRKNWTEDFEMGDVEWVYAKPTGL